MNNERLINALHSAH